MKSEKKMYRSHFDTSENIASSLYFFLNDNKKLTQWMNHFFCSRFDFIKL